MPTPSQAAQSRRQATQQLANITGALNRLFNPQLRSPLPIRSAPCTSLPFAAALQRSADANQNRTNAQKGAPLRPRL